MRRSRAFTLIELLVVVAIIALLIALIMPELQKAREQAKKTVCLSHLKQIGTAFFSYGGNNSGLVPDGGTLAFHYDPAIKSVVVDTPNGTNNWQVTWPEELWADGDVLEKYAINGTSSVTYSSGWADNRGIFSCPSAPQNNPPGIIQQNSHLGYGMGYYAGSIWYQKWNQNVTPPIPPDGYTNSAGKFVKPYSMKVHLWRAQGIVVVEGDSGFNVAIGAGGASAISTIDPATGTWKADSGRYGVYMRHQKGANYLLGDGHAEWSAIWNQDDQAGVPGVTRTFKKHPESNWNDVNNGQPPDSSVWGHNPSGKNGNANR